MSIKILNDLKIYAAFKSLNILMDIVHNIGLSVVIGFP